VQTILAAVDISQASHLAFKQALVLASSMRAEVVTVAVTPKYEGNMNRLKIKDANRQFDIPFLQCLEDAAEYAASLGIKITTLHRVGQPSEEIVKVAEEVNARFVLLGSPHRSQMERVLLGRTLSKVIAGSPCDVLLIPESAEIRFGRILVGVSGTQSGLMAAERALRLSRDYGSELHGVIAVDVSVENSLRYGVMNEAWQRGVEALETFTRLAGSMEYPVVTSLREERPDKCLLHYAEEQDMHLIVLGSHGHSWANDLFLDTVIERVASHSPCPVLVVNRTAAEA
jgi:hypothetical protein